VVRIDLHTHSCVSDGTDSPAELMRAAVGARLDVVALADHDTTAGWQEATDAAAVLGIVCVPAIEISTIWQGADVHLLAYWPDAGDDDLEGMLAGIRAGRRRRVPRMLAGLAMHGVTITEADVRAAAGDAVSLGRPHVADALVAAGVVGTRQEAFDVWLGDGMPGYAPKPAPLLEVAIRTVRAAGGVPVLAHPWGRGSRAVLDAAAQLELVEHGLCGVEVDHIDHREDDRTALRELAAVAGLIVTGGSDYHGTGKAGLALGACTTDEASYEALRRLAKPSS
jgi:predicted metal-dependent phosphoesterase TrpH